MYLIACLHDCYYACHGDQQFTSYSSTKIKWTKMKFSPFSQSVTRGFSVEWNPMNRNSLSAIEYVFCFYFRFVYMLFVLEKVNHVLQVLTVVYEYINSLNNLQMFALPLSYTF